MDRHAHVLKWQEANWEQISEHHNDYARKRDSDRNKEYQKQRRQVDPGFRMLMNLRGRVAGAMRLTGEKKSAKTRNLIGCTIPELRKHLEAQFLPGMSWDNYGQWHIDHKRPCASFDLLDPAQQRLCFHYTNLQPLWAQDNFRKNKKWEATVGAQIELL